MKIKKTQLIEQLAAPENLLTAWRAVRGNIPGYRRNRSAGPDGVTLADFERDLSSQLFTLRDMLLKNRYQPHPPGLFTLKKANGGTRQIAVLDVSDRVVQRAAQQVMEPLFEPFFLPCSFGFRPGRSIHDAVYCARRLRAHGYGWVVDGDIASCFDSLDHSLLLKFIAKRVEDDRFLDLLQKWLSVGVLKHGQPVGKTDWLSQSWEKTTSSLSNGFYWIFDALYQQQRDEPFLIKCREPQNDQTTPDSELSEFSLQEEVSFDPYENFYLDRKRDVFQKRELQKKALHKIMSGGLILGSGWMRQRFSELGPSALSALKSPAGREIIKHGLLVGGGALGTAAGLAVSTYLLYRQVAPSPVGVLQGSPLSPLLANIYLHSFDLSLTRAGYRLVRFADDWVILSPDQEHAETAYNQSIIALARLRLKVNSEKTHIRPPSERFEWLGEIIN